MFQNSILLNCLVYIVFCCCLFVACLFKCSLFNIFVYGSWICIYLMNILVNWSIVAFVAILPLHCHHSPLPNDQPTFNIISGWNAVKHVVNFATAFQLTHWHCHTRKLKPRCGWSLMTSLLTAWLCCHLELSLISTRTSYLLNTANSAESYGEFTTREINLVVYC